MPDECVAPQQLPIRKSSVDDLISECKVEASPRWVGDVLLLRPGWDNLAKVVGVVELFVVAWLAPDVLIVSASAKVKQSSVNSQLMQSLCLFWRGNGMS